MKNLTIALMVAASFAAVGCKKKGGAGEAMAKMGEFKDKMCACKDKKCADDVQDQMNKWSAENAKNAGDKAEAPDEKTMKEMQDVGTKYGECMAKAMGGGETPPPPPPPETGSGSAAAGSGSAAPAADAPKFGEGPVVPAMTLAKHDLPPFKGAPASALWTSAEAEKDGLKTTNLMDGDKMFVSVRFYDCNLPLMKTISTEDRASYQYCFVAPKADAGKVKNYPLMDKPDADGTAIRVGHVIVEASVAGPQKGKIKAEELAAFLETADFTALEK